MRRGKESDRGQGGTIQNRCTELSGAVAALVRRLNASQRTDAQTRSAALFLLPSEFSVLFSGTKKDFLFHLLTS